MKLRNFQLWELVPKEIYDRRGAQAIECMDLRIVAAVDDLRDNLRKEGYDNGFIINSWKSGGAKTQSGLRVYGQKEYSNTSQHSFGRAVDFTTKTPIKAIHKHILTNLDKYPHIRFIEVDISWCHVDCRDNFDDARIKLWSPKRGFVSVEQYLKELG